MRVLPLVEKLKSGKWLDESYDTARAPTVSFEQGSHETTAQTHVKLIRLADAVAEGMADGRLTFYEIFAIGVAFVQILKSPQEATVEAPEEKPKSRAKRGSKKD